MHFIESSYCENAPANLLLLSIPFPAFGLSGGHHWHGLKLSSLILQSLAEGPRIVSIQVRVTFHQPQELWAAIVQYEAQSQVIGEYLMLSTT